MIELDDFVILGTTVPEPQTRSGRIFVCSAGYSPQLGQLLRVYPLARRSVPHRWHIHRVQLERPGRQDDSRVESWKVAGDRSPEAHERINRCFTDTGVTSPGQRSTMLARLFAPSIRFLDEHRMSLGLITPRSVRVEVEHHPNHPDSPQLRLFDPTAFSLVPESPRFPLVPRLRFSDEDGEHRLMIRDWGVFELMRKRGPEYLCEHLSAALHLSSTSTLLVGNLSHQRNAWLVISVLNGLVVPTLELDFAEGVSTCPS